MSADPAVAVDPAIRDAMLAAVPGLRAYAISLCRNIDRADDLVQETLLRAWAHADSFEAGTNMSAWLFTILRNTYYTAVVRRRREVRDEDDRHAEAAHDALEDVVQQLDGFGGRHAAVVDVAGDEHGGGADVGDEVDELTEDVVLVVGEVDGVEQPSEMPIGGMDESHARTFTPDPSTAGGRT